MSEPSSNASPSSASNINKEIPQKDLNNVSSISIAKSVDIQGTENFPQGCSFSPDGLCVLTATVADAKLRLYNTPTCCWQPKQDSSCDTQDTTIDTNQISHSKNYNNTNEPSLTKDDAVASIVPVHNWESVLTSPGGDSVRSYAWYPQMKSSDPASCLFAAVSRDQPIHLYDAYTGVVRATYSPFNALDEMESPTVVTFSPSGQHIVSGGFRTDRAIYGFDTARPGRDATFVFKLGKTRRSSDGQKGLISDICFPPTTAGSSANPIFAVGTYAPGSIYVYDDRIGGYLQQPVGTILNGVCVVGHGKGHSKKKRRFKAMQDDDENEDSAKNASSTTPNKSDNWFSAAKAKWYQSKTQGGVTQLQFAPSSEYFLYSASRRSNTILAWDLRMLSGDPDYQSNPIVGIASFENDNDTNQRLEFDFDHTGKTLYVGGRDKCIRVYDVSTCKRIETITDPNFEGAVNGVSYCRGFGNGKSLLAVAAGARRFPSESELERDSDDESVLTSNIASVSNGSLSLYALKM